MDDPNNNPNADGDLGLPSEALPDGGDVAPADGSGNVNPLPSVELEKLNDATKREFKDPESAIKAIGDTFKYVGDIGKIKTLKEMVERVQSENNLPNTEAAVALITAKLQGEAAPAEGTSAPAEVDTSKFVSREEFEESEFYRANPTYAPHSAIIDAFRTKEENKGKSIPQLIAEEGGDSTLISTLSDAMAHATTKESKSVLESNPRLGEVKDKATSASEKAAKGDHQGAGIDAVDSVIGAYGLDEKQS